jgi:hypothetical protein
MQKEVLGLLALMAMTASLPVLAASETIDYTSATLGTTWSGGTLAGSVNDSSKFSLAITLSAPLGDNLKNANEASLVTGLTYTVGGKTVTLSGSEASGTYFDFTTSSTGVITGWNFTAGETGATPLILFHSCNNDSCASGSFDGNGYGATGDWYDEGPGTANYAGGCSYSSPTSCGTGSGAVGSWVVAAPELDAGNAAAGLTLLIGAVMVLRGARRKPVLTTA